MSKMDQIAYYCQHERQANELKKLFGLQDADWVQDTVTAKSTVYGRNPVINKAELQFNYDLGIELEILRYIEGPSWHTERPKNTAFISHVGIHLADGEEFPKMSGCTLVQETFTLEHTAPYLTTGAGAGRKYHYRIYEIGRQTYIKHIKRIHPMVLEP